MSDDTKDPLKVPMIVDLTAVFPANTAFANPSAIEPILTLNLVDQFGRIVLLPLADTALAKILRMLKLFEQGQTGLPGLAPFEPPTEH